jgi:hypothetical protein
MRIIYSLGAASRLSSRFFAIVLTLLVVVAQTRADFWTIRGKGQLETVTLSRDLPPVATRFGNTVQFLPEIAASSVPQEVAMVLRSKIQTLLMNTKGGAIQLVESSPDTVIRCIITGYEPKVIHMAQRDVGNEHQGITTWIGNIEASVQVLDKRNNPIDSANVKSHLEKDYVLTRREDQVTAITQKQSWRDRMGGALSTVRNGVPGLGQAVALAGAGQKIHDAVTEKQQPDHTPTDLEWRDMLIESLASRVANRIVPVSQEFTAVLPLDTAFAQARELAKAKHWGEVEEQMDKMAPIQGPNEAYRLYLLGLSYEAQACTGSEPPKEAAEQLNKATKYYDDAHKLRPGEHELFLAQIRAQDSLDHYLEIEHALELRAHAPVREQNPPVPSKPAADVADNAQLIALVQAKMTEPVLLAYVQGVQDPKFDVSATGLLEMRRAGVPLDVIAAAQKRMLAPRTSKPMVKRTQAVPQSK